MKALKISVKAAAILYLVIVAVFFVAQRRLLYYPTRGYTPLTEAQANEVVKEISVKTADGLLLKAWYAPATVRSQTIVFFHGNADSLRTAVHVADPYRECPELR